MAKGKINFAFEQAPKMTRFGTANPEEVRIAAQLRTHPGREARVFEYDEPKTAAMTARLIRRGERAAFGPGFEAKSRTVDGKGLVYVTYVGQSDWVPGSEVAEPPRRTSDAQ